MHTESTYHCNSMENRHTFDIAGLVCAYHFTAKPNFEPRPEQYGFSQIFLVLEGSGRYTSPHGSYTLSPGVMFYRPADQESIYEWDSDKVSFGIISFVCSSPDMQAFEGAPIFLQEEERATLLDVIKTGVRICEPLRHDQPLLGMRFKDGIPDAVFDFLRASLERFFAMLYCRMRGIDLLHEQTEKVSRVIDDSRILEAAKSYLSGHLAKQLSVKALCEELGVSQTTLTRLFRRELDRGVMEYFTELKIKEAKQQIRKSDRSFTEIAESLGFSSVNYFSRVFKQKTGLTPTEYSRYVSKH